MRFRIKSTPWKIDCEIETKCKNGNSKSTCKERVLIFKKGYLNQAKEEDGAQHCYEIDVPVDAVAQSNGYNITINYWPQLLRLNQAELLSRIID